MDPFGPLPRSSDQDRGSVLLITLIVTFVFASILVVLRVWTRIKVAGSLGWDDYLIFIGVIFAVGTIAPFIKALQAGLGRHAKYLSIKQVVEVGLWTYIAQYIVAASTMAIRLSVACFLMRIFGTTKVWRRGLTFGIIFIIITNVLTLVLSALPCRPIQKSWNPALHGTCWSPSGGWAVIVYQGVVGATCDWSLALLPIVGLWNSQLKLRKKIVVWTLMGMGFFTGICPLVRLLLVRSYKTPDQIPDTSWILLDQAIWAVLEMNFGIIASCIPTLKPLLEHAIKSLKPHVSRPYMSASIKIDSARQFQSHDGRCEPSIAGTEVFPLTNMGVKTSKELKSPVISPPLSIDEVVILKHDSASSFV